MSVEYVAFLKGLFLGGGFTSVFWAVMVTYTDWAARRPAPKRRRGRGE